MVAMILFNSVILRSPDIHAIIKEQRLVISWWQKKINTL